MSVVLTLMVLAVASATLVLALRRRKSQLVPVYARRPADTAPERADGDLVVGVEVGEGEVEDELRHLLTVLSA